MKQVLISFLFIASVTLSSTGYANSTHDDLRLYNKVVYKVLDTYGFVIYSKDMHVVGGKARLSQKKFYFSINERSDIIPLTIHNLKKTFHDREFHDLLDTHFRSNHELTQYDPYFKEYKIKYLFRKAFSGNGAEF